jgi:hypothetical protein
MEPLAEGGAQGCWPEKHEGETFNPGATRWQTMLGTGLLDVRVKEALLKVIPPHSR